MNPNDSGMFPKQNPQGTTDPDMFNHGPNIKHQYTNDRIKPQIDDKPITVAPSEDANATAKHNYLDEISPKQPGNKLFSKKFIIILAALAVVLVIVAVIALMSGGNRVKNASGEALGQRMLNLQELVKYANSNHITDSQTVRTNSETSLVLLSSISSLTKAYGEGDKSGFANPSKEIVAQYSNADTISKLDSAKANSNLNPAYATALKEQLAETSSMIQSLYDNSKSDDIRTALAATYKDFQELIARLPAKN